MTDEVIFDAPAPKAKKKIVKKKAVRAAAPAQAQDAERFPGMTRIACADGCNEKGCVISEKPYCAHPTKGGLQAGDQGNPQALRRMQEARAQLGVQIDKNRFT